MSLFNLIVDILLVLVYIAAMVSGFTLLGFTISQAAISVAFIIGAIIITVLWCNYYD
jgi:hypothetical protein